MVCQYSELLGIPGKGIHTRYMGIAYMDVLMTLILTEVISYLFGYNFFAVFFALLLTGVLIHRLFCVRTTVDKWLFE